MGTGTGMGLSEQWGAIGAHLQGQYNASGLPLTITADEGVQDLYRRLADETNRRAIAAQQAAEQQAHDQRLQAHADRISRALNLTQLKPTRHGRRVACLTRRDTSGRAIVFKTVTAAGISVQHRADDVSQAIRRQGTCGGHAFQYLGDGEAAPMAHAEATLYLGGSGDSSADANRRRQVKRHRRAA